MSEFNTLRLNIDQTVAIGASSAASSAFNAQTYDIRVCADVDCYIKIAKSPTATTSTTYIPANTPEYFHVTPGEKVAVIQDAASGTLYVTECTR